MIRVCLKGVDEESFEKITGARKEFFMYPIIALKEMKMHEINTWPAIMGNIFSRKDIERLMGILSKNGVATSLEKETLEVYPFVKENMTNRRSGSLSLQIFF